MTILQILTTDDITISEEIRDKFFQLIKIEITYLLKKLDDLYLSNEEFNAKIAFYNDETIKYLIIL